jgi:hypothetical protein
VASFVTNITVFYQTQRPSQFTIEKHPEPAESTPKSIPLKSTTVKQLQPHHSLLPSVPQKNLAFISIISTTQSSICSPCIWFSTADNRAMKTYEVAEA